MLLLQRKVGQRIVIGDDVVVEVVEISGDRIKLGVTAPREVPVFREELLSESQRANLPPTSAERRSP